MQIDISQLYKTREGPFKCLACSDLFNTIGLLSQHLKSEHSVQNQTFEQYEYEDEIFTPSAYSCDQCKQHFYYEYVLMKHKTQAHNMITL